MGCGRGESQVAAGFFGGLSTDVFGTMLAQALAASGVDLQFAPIVPRPSTLAFVALADGEARYAFFDEGSAGRMLTQTDLPAFPTTVTALHFGSLSLAANLATVRNLTARLHTTEPAAPGRLN